MNFDPSLLLVALASGFAAHSLKLPPLIGYLIAGMALNFLSITPPIWLDEVSQIGITLLLFIIGLKLNFRQLLKTEIWLGTSLSMGATIGIGILLLLVLNLFNLQDAKSLDVKAIAAISFALSFSSTVVAVKILEQRGELKTRHGQITLSILVLQDLIAVIFLTLSSDQSPSPWALLLLTLPLLRPGLFILLQHCRHGELLPLAGIGLAYIGAELFEYLHLKAELGALMMGILLAPSVKATELAKSLLSIKDILLIGFFFSIGFMATPTWSMLAFAIAITCMLPIKMLVFYLSFSLVGLRSRTALLSSLSLSNFSEFGLIVGALSVSAGWFHQNWIVIIALACTFSFMFSSILLPKAHLLYAKFQSVLKRTERAKRLPEDQWVQPEGARILIIGMGRVGTGAYEEAARLYPAWVCGVDADRQRVRAQQIKGRKVIKGDAEDADFWHNLDLNAIKLIMLAMPTLNDMLDIVVQLKLAQYQGEVAAIAKFEDDRQILLEAGVDVCFNMYAQAGAGFATETFEKLPALLSNSL